jgi:hypothetical protein
MNLSKLKKHFKKTKTNEEEEEEDEKFIDNLLKSLNDESNEYILDLTTEKIKKMNLEALQELAFSKETTREYMKQLKTYVYIDELQNLRYGSFLRWISLKDPEPSKLILNKGALFCEIKVTDDGISLIVKNFRNKYFSLKFDEVMIFQKLKDQELVLLQAMDML